MPWKETDVLKERVRFVVEALQGETSMTALCAAYGVSRKTGYKWLRRYEGADTLGGLVDRSRRPRYSPGQTPEAVEARVVALREQYGWGSRKLQRLLEDEGIRLSRSTIDRILRQHGLIVEATRARPAVRRFVRAACNELVQMDFKGQYRLAGDGWCYPLSLLDDHSRYVLALAALPDQGTERVQPVVAACFERYGVPEAMLVDHGTPWWSSTNGHGLTRLSVFLIRQGIDLVYSGIAHPQTQGKVERFHRTLADWLEHHGRPRTLEGFAAALEALRCEYNEVRPHEALGLKTPATRYVPSRRAYQANPPPWNYPAGSDVRRLSENGCLYLEGRYHFVCHALANRLVCCETFGDRILVIYRHMLIRELHVTSGSSRTVLKPYGPTGH